MEYLGNVSSEGGPLLITDVALVRHWRGATFDSQDDYQRACDIFTTESKVEGGFVSIDAGQGLVWEMGGAGTSDVFLKSPGHLMIVRGWLDDPEDVEVVASLARAPLQEFLRLGSFHIETGVVAVLWAPESGQDIETTDFKGRSVHIEGTSVEGSGLLMKLEAGKYLCFHDEVAVEQGEARRLHLIKQD